MPKKRRSKCQHLCCCERAEIEYEDRRGNTETNRSNCEDCSEYVCSCDCGNDLVKTNNEGKFRNTLSSKKLDCSRAVYAGHFSGFACSCESKRKKETPDEQGEAKHRISVECNKFEGSSISKNPVHTFDNTVTTTIHSEGTTSTRETFSQSQKSDNLSMRQKFLDACNRFIYPYQLPVREKRKTNSDKDFQKKSAQQTEDDSFSKQSFEEKVARFNHIKNIGPTEFKRDEEEIKVFQESNDCPEYFFISAGHNKKHSLRTHNPDHIQGYSSCLSRGEPVEEHSGKYICPKKKIILMSHCGDGPDSCEEICVDDKQCISDGVCWITSAIALKHFPSKWLGALIRECFIYFLFFICVSTAVLSREDSALYYYCHSVHELLLKAPYEANALESLNISKTYFEMNSISDQWSFIKTVFVPNVYVSQVVEEKLNVSDSGMEMLQSILIGVPRMRQVRVKPDECQVPSRFKNTFKVCYNYYTRTDEDTKSFGKKEDNGWKYSEDPQDRTYFGKISYYFGGGYSYYFSNSSTEASDDLEYLYQNSWIDRGTRAVFLDFTLYSPSTNYFHMIKLAMEVPPSGGVLPSAHCYSMKFFNTVSFYDYFIIGIEAFIFMFIIYFTAELFRELFFFGRFYILLFWGVYDILLIMMSYTYLTLLIYTTIISYYDAHKLMDNSFSDSKYFPNFGYVSQLRNIFHMFGGVYLFIVFIKMFKFLNMSKTYRYFTSTLSYCCLQLICHIVLITNIVLMFAVVGHALFGSQVLEFSSIGWSFFTLSTVAIGTFTYGKIVDFNFIMGPIFIYSFIITILVFIVNFVIAIVVHAYSVTYNQDSDKQCSRLFLGEAIMRYAKRTVDKDGTFYCEAATSSSSCPEFEPKPKVTECYFAHVDPLLQSSDKSMKQRSSGKSTKPPLKNTISASVEKNVAPNLRKPFETQDQNSYVKVLAEDIKYHNQLMLLKNRVDSLDNTLDQVLAKMNIVLNKIISQETI